jgi:hypothetical protein
VTKLKAKYMKVLSDHFNGFCQFVGAYISHRAAKACRRLTFDLQARS